MQLRARNYQCVATTAVQNFIGGDDRLWELFGLSTSNISDLDAIKG